MPTRVGAKGQVVIEKAIRERLGVGPGATAVQRLVGDHVEIRFLPPVHRRSLLGVLAPYTSVRVPPEAWRAARERAHDTPTESAWEGEASGDRR